MMEWMVLYGIACCIIVFIYRECVALYTARIRSSGIMLESSTRQLMSHHTNKRIQRLDYILFIVAAVTLLLYCFIMAQKIIEHSDIPELTIMEAGIALLLYIIFPSRKITHFITEKGLEERGKTTEWHHIHAIYITDEAAARRMLLVTFRGRSTSVEGYMYDRDIGSLKQLIAPHSIMLREL